MMRRLAAVLLLVPSLALAQTVDDPAPAEDAALDEEEPAASFDDVKPGTTKLRWAYDKLGKPAKTFDARVVQGEMDPLVSPASADGKDEALSIRARNAGKGLSWVHVLEYQKDGARTLLVFRDEVLWFALLPARAGETKAAEVQRRYGADPRSSTFSRKIDGKQTRARTFLWPDSGVGYVQLEGSETYAWKMLFKGK